MRLIRGLGAAIVVVLIFYLLPTLIESKLAPLLGVSAYIFLGDLFGCACIAVYHRKIGVGLYAILVCSKVALFTTHLVPASELLWASDALPSFFLAAMVLLACATEDDGLYWL
jgi:hypothetical protein